MIGKKIETTILSVQMIPNADPALLKKLKAIKSIRSIGIITTDCDDVGIVALDHATKKADVRVLYAESMYAGDDNASTALAGEFIGILGASNPEDIKSGLDAAVSYIENDASFYSSNEEESSVYFAHCISRTGSYLSKQASIKEGESVSYLVAPPNEAICGIDAALKSADVTLKVFDGPPTHTNFAGALLTGDQSACQVACEEFANAVRQVANRPRQL